MQQAWICRLEQKTLEGFPPEQEAWAGTVKGLGARSRPAHSYSARDTGCEQLHRDVDESIKIKRRKLKMTLQQRFSPKTVTAFHNGTKRNGAFQAFSWQVV